MKGKFDFTVNDVHGNGHLEALTMRDQSHPGGQCEIIYQCQVNLYYT